VPELQADGRVLVDMGEPILNGADVPTTLPADESGRVIAAPLEVAGEQWTVTAVSMGNPHAVVFSRNGSDVVVSDPHHSIAACSAAWHSCASGMSTTSHRMLLVYEHSVSPSRSV
jgi:diaminopimelate epimerase